MSELEPDQQAATIDPPRAVRVKTSTGWADLAIKGAPGKDGVDGANFNYRGDYNATVTYNHGDMIVGPDGITYLCVTNGTVGVTPAPWATAWAGVPLPVVNGQWVKGVGGAATWAAITPGDVSGAGLVVADTAWHVIGAAGEIGFQGGYAGWDNRVPRFRKLATGLVVLNGILSCPAAGGSGTIAFTLPAGYRIAPGYGDLTFWVNGSQTPTNANVFADGRFTIGGANYPAGSWCYIDGVQFYAEA